MKNLLIALSCIFSHVITLSAQYAGSYVVGPPPSDFIHLNEFQDSVAAQGMAGPVELLMKPGVHSTPVTWSRYTNFSKPLQIRSQNGIADSTTVVMSFMQELDSLTISNITIRPHRSSGVGYPKAGLEFSRPIEVLLDSCKIVGLNLPKYRNGISVRRSKGFRVKNCSFENLESGIVYSGYPYFGIDDHENLNTVSNCVFTGVKDAITLEGVFLDSMVIESNSINGGELGIHAISNSFEIHKAVIISGNYIKSTKSCLYLGRSQGFGNGSYWIHNNMLTGGDSIGRWHSRSGQIDTIHYTRTILLNEVDKAQISHNSVVGGLDLFYPGALVKFYNNALKANQDVVVFIEGSSLGSRLINNSFYSTGKDTVAYVIGQGFKRLGDPDFTNLQNVWADPHFVSTTDLHACSPELKGKGAPTNINLDFDGEPRLASKPDIGADEFKNSPIRPCAFGDVSCGSISLSQNFTDLSPRSLNTYWSFSDGGSDTGKVVNKVFSAPGLYTYFMIAENTYGSDTTTGAVDLSSVIPQSIHPNGNTLSVDSGYAQYQWYLDSLPISGADSNFYLATIPGHYGLRYLSELNCLVWAENSTFLSAKEFTMANPEVYPIPASHYFIIDWKTGASAEVELFDMRGHLLLEESLASGENKVSIDGFASGVYFIKIKSDQYEFYQKIQFAP